MIKYIRIIILTLILSFMVCVSCFAQILLGTDNFAGFVVNDNWRQISIKDNVTIELITIAYGRDTVISLKKGKDSFGFRELKDCSYADKVALKDICINRTLTNLRSQGYVVGVHNATISNNTIGIGYFCSLNGKTYRASETFVVKGYQGYSLVTFCIDETVMDVYDAVSNLIVNGKPWFEWII